MTNQEHTDWERIWHRLLSSAATMTPQGREYLHLAQRLVRANRVLLEIPELEDDAYQEMQGVSMLLRSVGGPEEKWLVQLLGLITHLLDMLYVRLEYIKWEVSPLSELTGAIQELLQEEDANDHDRALLEFLSEYDAAVRSSTGLFDEETLTRLQARADALDPAALAGAHRQVRALVDLVHRLLRYDPDDDWLA